MNKVVYPAIGAAVGFLLAKAFVSRREEVGEEAFGFDDTWILLGGAALGAAAVAYVNPGSDEVAAENNPRKCNDMGSLPQAAVKKLEEINVPVLYRKEVTDQLQIGPVYPNEKTVGTF
jgi:hypothetical protein